MRIALVPVLIFLASALPRPAAAGEPDFSGALPGHEERAIRIRLLAARFDPAGFIAELSRRKTNEEAPLRRAIHEHLAAKGIGEVEEAKIALTPPEPRSAPAGYSSARRTWIAESATHVCRGTIIAGRIATSGQYVSMNLPDSRCEPKGESVTAK
ncbi:MAG: hypothetical protein HY553_06980 [Elusimicrobia bacterium]|nr:hypothetical protein [Elusimicrobiota bacterium]